MPKSIMVLNNIETEYACFSENTRFHKINHDFHCIFEADFGKIYIVSRGIGQDGAEIISHLAVIAIKDFFEKLPGRYHSVVALKSAIKNATKEVLTYISTHQWLKNCGASVALLLMNNKGVFIAHAGDCRIYLLRANKVFLLTKDHFTYHKISETYSEKEESYEIPVIYNTIGLTNVEPDIQADFQLYKDDFVFLTTKGVYQRVTRQEMIKAFVNKELTEGLNKLWEFAKNKKCFEDFTLIVLKVVNAPIRPLELQEIKREKFKLVLNLIFFCISLTYFFVTISPYILVFFVK